MFSLHIDTARSWRGGQNQVLLTVNGLREIGERAALVAHPDGELLKRAAEGLDLVPLAARTEMDLSAAWRLSRVLKRLRPDVVHAHDPHGVAMAALALSMTGSGPSPPLVASRRVDFHLKTNSLSRWKHRQVDCFIAASDAIRKMLLTDGVPAHRDRHRARGDRHLAHRRGAGGERARSAVAAASRAARRQRRGAGAAQRTALSDRSRARWWCGKSPTHDS